MTEEQFQKASELAQKRDYYKELVEKVEYAKLNKNRLDDNARRKIETQKEFGGYSNLRDEKWQLAKYFRVRFFNRETDGTPAIGVLPHWDFAHEIKFDADPELIDIIHEWMKKKMEEYNKQIEEI